MSVPIDHQQLPYRVAALCYLYDDADRVLLLHRAQSPNLGMYSPIGGKLAVASGESPHDCAIREIHEEAGLTVDHNELHLTGIVAETAYEGQNHWLLFLFEVCRPIAHDEVAVMEIREGTLEWVAMDKVTSYRIPETDRNVVWPLVQSHRRGFFTVHIDCRDGLHWQVQESR